MARQLLKQVRPEELPEVLRLAAELYASDRAAVERVQECEQVQAAASEIGLPPEYLERAAAMLRPERRPAAVPGRRRRVPWLAVLGAILALWIGAWLLLLRTP